MPTIRGWICLGFGVGAIALGRFFGLSEMYVIGAVLLALVFVAVLVAVFRPLRLGVGRSITPSRMHVGTTGRVEVAVRNGSARSPVIRMTDRVQGTNGAQLFISPLNADETTKAAYRLPTERRGLVKVGPVDFESIDAFGLAVRRFNAPSVGQMVVYPEVIPLPPAPPSPASERRSASDQPQFIGGRSEEFHALRAYVPGDDVRRVNWAASARHDDLIVREDEAPTQNHLTVLLDNAAFTSVDSLDRATSVAASILTSMRSRSDPFRLLTIDGGDTGYVLGPAGLDQALSILAMAESADRVERLGEAAVLGAQGALVLVTSGEPSINAEGFGRYGRIMAIALAPSVWDPQAPRAASSAEAAGNEIRLNLGSMDDLASLWGRAITTLMSGGSGMR